VYIHDTVADLTAETEVPAYTSYFVPYPKALSGTLEKTTRKNLDNVVTVSYSANLAATELSNPNVVTGGIVDAGYFALDLKLANLFVTEVDEVDPVSITTLLGVISGFWNFVPLFFGLIFVGIDWQADERTIFNRLRCSKDPSRQEIQSSMCFGC
jgi:hypothetical protein